MGIFLMKNLTSCRNFSWNKKKQIENYALELLSSKKNRVVEQQKFVETDHLLAKIDLYEKNLNSGKNSYL
jgi:hypothetical protein